MSYNRGDYDGRDDGRYRQQPGQGNNMFSNFKGRLIMALLIAGVGWCMYMNQVEVNPVTGKKQHVAISPDQEIKLGLESAPQMSREMGGLLPATNSKSQEVEKMGQYIVSKGMDSNSPWKFKFHLLADTQNINAFALPGGQIFITLGLLDKLQTEAQLAGVLSHEIGHVIERHTAQQMATSQFGQMLVVAVGSAIGGGAGGASDPTQIANMVNQIIQLKYSREDESQADEWGLKLMEKAGFDPYAMIEVMKILKAASGGKGGEGVPQIFQTHPDPDLRIQQIQEYLKANPPKPGLTEGQNLRDVYKRIGGTTDDRRQPTSGDEEDPIRLLEEWLRSGQQ